MNETTKKPFHLVITDNETGETVRELDFDAIIGAIHTGEQECGGIIISRCNGLSLAETMASAKATLEKAEEDSPIAAFAAKIMIGAEVYEPQNQEENEEKGE